jgi:hypothetical protein
MKEKPIRSLPGIPVVVVAGAAFAAATWMLLTGNAMPAALIVTIVIGAIWLIAAGRGGRAAVR